MLPVVLIPARMQSTRLPGKPLADIAGKPMVWHVWSQASKANVSRVVIATDSRHIANVMRDLGAEVVLTSESHTSGTERLAQASEILALSDETPVINVQGDEPLIDPMLVNQVGRLLENASLASMATLCEPIRDAGHLMNPNMVKVVTDPMGYALTFSRSPIPWHRDLFGAQLHADTILPSHIPFCRHLGIYAYRAGFLRQYAAWKPCELEKIEALEQLRVQWYGHKIAVEKACASTHAGVDTPEDLARVRQVFMQKTGRV